MGRAAGSLLDAVLRTSVGENQITEVLACLLDQDRDVRDRFCRLINAPALQHAELLTQRPIPGTGIIDCELRLVEGSRLHVVWIEVKVDAPEGYQQLRRYASWLWQHHRGRSTLVALAPNSDAIFESAEAPFTPPGLSAPVRPRTAERVTWADLGRELNRIGAERSSTASWRTAARMSDAPARQRALCEALEYFERRRIVEPDDPITSLDAHVIHRAPSLLGGALGRILDLASSRVTLMAGRDVASSESRRGGLYWQSRTVPWDFGGWQADTGATLAELLLVWNDGNDRSDGFPRGEPIFLAGIQFAGLTPDTIEQIRNAPWMNDNVWINPNGKWARVQCGLYVSDLAVRGVSLSTQAEALSDWANGAFEKLRNLPDPRQVTTSSKSTMQPEGRAILEVFKERGLGAGSRLHPTDFGQAIVWEGGFVRDEAVRAALQELFENGYLLELGNAFELTSRGEERLNDESSAYDEPPDEHEAHP